LRIAIDARELAGKPTGVGRFLSEIVREWVDLPAARAHEFGFCAPDSVELPVSIRKLNVRVDVAPGGGTYWEQIVLPRMLRRLDASVLLAPGYSGPLFADTPMVVAVHDVSFAAHPEWFRWREGLRRRFITRNAAQRAARVITISEFSRREIAEHLGVLESRIDVVYPGVTRPAQVERRRSGEPEATVLYVGSLFNRRHIPELMAGFSSLAARHPDVRLDIVGDNRTFPHIDIERLARDSHAADRIRIRPYVDDTTLGQLYAGTRAFAFLSEYEGFGMTPLEALSAGVPIVVLDTAVAREVYGPAAIYVQRPDPALIDAALERALFDEPARARVLEHAARVLARYSWRTCAEQVLGILTAAGTDR
jgi:glycosyltransferase involved in cell wall biosynthesis